MTATDLTAALKMVTTEQVDVLPSSDGVMVVYVTKNAKDGLRHEANAVEACLANLGAVGRRVRVNGSTMWRTIIGRYGECRGYNDKYRVGFEVRF